MLVVGGGSFGTLLGPEITGPHFCVVLVVAFVVVAGSVWGGVWLFLVFPRMPCSVLVRGVGVGVLGLLVENCIVDASILKKKQFLR